MFSTEINIYCVKFGAFIQVGEFNDTFLCLTGEKRENCRC